MIDIDTDGQLCKGELATYFDATSSKTCWTGKLIFGCTNDNGDDVVDLDEFLATMTAVLGDTPEKFYKMTGSKIKQFRKQFEGGEAALAAQAATIITGIINGMPGPDGPSAYVIVGKEDAFGDNPPKYLMAGGRKYVVKLEGGGDYMVRGATLQQGKTRATIIHDNGESSYVTIDTQSVM